MKNSNAKFHIARPRGIFAAFVLASAMGSAPGQTLTAPAAPAIFTARDEQSLFLVPPAVRAHGYICLRTAAGAATASWAVEPSRPEATRFEHVFGQDIQIATDALSTDANPNEAAPTSLPFGSATWQSSFNPSQIWAQVLPFNSIPAGSDFLNAAAIPSRLLESVGSQPTYGWNDLLGNERHSVVEHACRDGRAARRLLLFGRCRTAKARFAQRRLLLLSEEQEARGR